MTRTLLLYAAALAMLVLLPSLLDAPHAAAQGSGRWSPAQTIPGYGDETNPPILIADQNKTVHAFASQLVGEDDQLLAITYNQWRLDEGWTKPIDIMLSPLKAQAQLLDVHLDEQGIFHVIFFGGDETEASLYYSKAYAADAPDSRAWSPPEPIGGSMVPPSGVIAEDAEGNIIVLFGDDQDGNGVYVTTSGDRGNNWSEPIPIGLAQSSKLLQFNISIGRTSDGRFHAIWQLMTIVGQGRGVFYSRHDRNDGSWSLPVDLSVGDKMTGLGTMTSALLVYDDVLFAFYNVNGKIVMRRSEDGGNRWNPASPIFAQHVGVNGPPSLVVDSDNQLHMLFAQRISGSPDIHGVWHSLWRGGNWSEPVAVISGPQIPDLVDDRAFDPVEPYAIISQGNVLLVVWRQDAGLKGNGVWFSHVILDAPELPPEELPPEELPRPTKVSTVSPIAEGILVGVATDAPSAVSPLGPEGCTSENALQSAGVCGPAAPIVVSLIPVLLLMTVIVVWKWHH